MRCKLTGAMIVLVTSTLVAIARGAEPGVTPGDSASQELYAATKALVDKYVHKDYPDAGALQASETLRAKGPEVVPALIRLFREAETDSPYRSAAIGAMLSLKGDKAEAIRFVETELSKNPRDWGSTGWVFIALVTLEKMDEAKARWAALRALEADEHSIRVSAIGIFRRIGQKEDLPSLEAFAARPKKEGVTGNEADEIRELQTLTDAAIKAIQARTAVLKEVEGTPSASRNEIAMAPAAGTKSTERSDKKGGRAGNSMMPIIGISVLLAIGLLILFLRRH